MNSNWSLFTNIVLAIITAIYAVLTYKILNANKQVVSVMRDQFKAMTRPYIAIDVFAYSGSPLLKLRFRNLGNSAAENVRFDLDRSFYRFGRSDEDIRDTHLFKVPLKTFAPHSEMIFDLGVSFEIFKDAGLTPWEFMITAAYDSGHDHYTENTYVNLGHLRKAAANPEPLVAELRSMNEILSKIAKQ